MTDWSEPLVNLRNSMDRLKHLLNKEEWTEGKLLAERMQTAIEDIWQFCKEREGP